MAKLIKVKREDGTYHKKWYSDLRINGKRVQRALSEFKPKAQRMLDEMLEVRRVRQHGGIVSEMSWESFQKTYLDWVLSKREKDTFYQARNGFNIVNAITHVNDIGEMTPERLDRIQVEASKKYPPASLSRGIRAIKTAMRWAEDRKYVGMQNWRIVEIKEPAGRIDFYEIGPFVDLLKKLEGPAFTAALIMGRAGLRLGECLNLEWSDIQQNHIVFRSKPHLGWFIKQDRHKLKKIRTVPLLTADLRQHLGQLRKPSGFVLEGVPRNEHAFSRFISAALKETKIKTHNGQLGFPHLLRHTFGSHMAQIGRDLQEIRDWMGHSSIRMTECYSHLCPGKVTHDPKVFEKLSSTFHPGPDFSGSSSALLSPFNADLESADLHSDIHETS